MATTFPHLCELIEESTGGVRDIVKRRMFGCDAYFVGDTIFALIWKTGRIGVKLPEAGSYAELLALEGAETWCVAANKRMATWVLVPEEFHDDLERLRPWVRRAVQQALGGGRSAGAKQAAKRTERGAAKKVAKAAAKNVTDR